MRQNEQDHYCRLYSNGAIDDKCEKQCKDCKTLPADHLLKKNFIL